VNIRDIDSRAKVRCAEERYVEKKVEAQQMQLAGVLGELLLIHDDCLVLSNSVHLTFRRN
jgi:hypothetical protein